MMLLLLLLLVHEHVRLMSSVWRGVAPPPINGWGGVRPEGGGSQGFGVGEFDVDGELGKGDLELVSLMGRSGCNVRGEVCTVYLLSSSRMAC